MLTAWIPHYGDKKNQTKKNNEGDTHSVQPQLCPSCDLRTDTSVSTFKKTSDRSTEMAPGMDRKTPGHHE